MTHASDDPAYRHGLLVGRAQTLAEVSRLVGRMSGEWDANSPRSEMLDQLLLGWSELTAWLAQSAEESVQEALLLVAAPDPRDYVRPGPAE